MRGIRLRAYRMVVCLGLSSGIMGLAYPTAAWALTYPADGNWVPLTQGLTPIGDVAGDSSTAVLDIVGSAEYPMAYVQSDATHLYFRLRLDRSILQNQSNVKPYGWGCVIDTNMDPSSFEYSAILDGNSNPDAVTIWQNLIQEMPNNPGDWLGNMKLYSYIDPFNPGQPGYGYARQVTADTMFGTPNPDPDYFADWAIERSRLAPAVDGQTPLRFACGSASDGKNLNSDFSGPENLPDLFSDPVLCDDSGCYAQTCPEFGAACSVGIGGCAGTGTMICLANGPVCNAKEKLPSAETCNGVDDDCNGAVDEGNPGSGMACTSSMPGICAAGTTACIEGALACTPIATPQPETCNGVDDDCDGIPDDGLPGGGNPCDTGLLGVCAAGFTTCGGGQVQCSAVTQPGTETCNGLDDDCNGSTDEGFDLGAACTVGIGACAATGNIACDASGSASCNVQAGTPVAEVCGDLVDSDCDGNIDNNCPDTDGDGIPDHVETQIGTDPLDADTDDDGVRDGMEIDLTQDSDGDGKINVLDPDSDNDGLFDGTEMGFDCAGPGTDVSAGHCIEDADAGLTTTNPIDADTDHGSLPDGKEDINANGEMDKGEKNPLDPKDDIDTVPQCLDDTNCSVGQVCVNGMCQEGCRGVGPAICPVGQTCTSSNTDPGQCIPVPTQDPVFTAGGGCDCQTGSSENIPGGLAWTLALASAVLLRRKRR